MNNNQQKPPREIERKFRVKRLPPGLEKFPREKIAQGYLVVGKGSHVRLRKRGDVCSLTYKRGPARAREEREVALTAEQFDTLWPATKGRRLTKVRYEMAGTSRSMSIAAFTTDWSSRKWNSRMKEAARNLNRRIGWARM